MVSSFSAFSSKPPRSEMPTFVDEGARVLVVDDSVTILKVVGTILEMHGYSVVVARDGIEALRKVDSDGPFDLVLLDFVMPRMNGYQFCRELRANDEHKSLSVVLMSARTEAIGDRFVEQTGAVDALSKPFDARALVAVVGAVLAKRREQGVVVRELPSPDMMLDEAELAMSPESLPPPSRHFRTVSRLAAQVATAVMPHLKAMRSVELQQPLLVEDAVASGLGSDQVIEQLAQTLEELDTRKSSNVVLRGEIDKMALAEILQVLQLRHQTGLLKVTSGSKSMVMTLRRGLVDLVQAKGMGDKFLLGRYFVEPGWLSREQVEEQVGASGDKLLGEQLVSEELVTEAQRDEALDRQSAELCYEMIRWQKGRFTLVEEPCCEEAEKAELGLGLGGLVLEGFRRVDEWRHMSDTVDFNAVLVVDQVALDGVGEEKIGKTERILIDAIDGERSVREVIEKAHIASFDAIKIIYGFVQSRIIRPR